LTDGTLKKITELTGHDGPILNLTWAHPQFGTLIATSGMGKIIKLL